LLLYFFFSVWQLHFAFAIICIDALYNGILPFQNDLNEDAMKM